MSMNDMGPNSDRAAEYLGIIRDVWPLALLAGGVAFAAGLRRIRRGYLQRSPVQVLGNLLLGSLVMSALAVGAVLLAPLLAPDISRGMDIGVAIFVGGFGMKFFDLAARRLFGLSVVDLMDPDDINSLRARMTPDRRRDRARDRPCRESGDATDEESADGRTL